LDCYQHIVVNCLDDSAAALLALDLAASFVQQSQAEVVVDLGFVGLQGDAFLVSFPCRVPLQTAGQTASSFVQHSRVVSCWDEQVVEIHVAVYLAGICG
jgi:hypothetical protein